MSGRILRISSYGMPQRPMTPALKFSMTASDMPISRFTNSIPWGVLTFRDTPSLAGFPSQKPPLELGSGSSSPGLVASALLRALTPRLPGHCILMTSAPSTASQRVAQGPARTHVKSRMRMPSRGREGSCPELVEGSTLNLLCRSGGMDGGPPI